MDKFQIFKVDFYVQNLGFSTGINVEIYLQGLKNFTIYKILDSNSKQLSSNQNIESLNIGDIKPLEKKEFYLYAKLPLNDWVKMKQNFDPKNSETNLQMVKITTTKYPMIEWVGENVERGLYLNQTIIFTASKNTLFIAAGVSLLVVMILIAFALVFMKMRKPKVWRIRLELSEVN